MKKVFISSTYKDLKHHRTEIWKRIQNLDIEVLGMENFGARKSSPLETCLEEVDRSDIYIGIISMCAGTIHSELKKSYTELEYQRALEKGKDIWIYLIDENDGVIKAGDIEFGERQEYLKKFKERLKSHTVDFFIDEKNLAEKIFKKLKSVAPKIKKLAKRPQQLECTIFKFKSKRYKWYIFMSFYNQLPYEIFSGINDDDYNGILLPQSVSNGIVIESQETKNIKRYDFQYINKRGYKTTLEGINYPFIPTISSYDKQITKLLQNNVSLLVILEVLREMLVEDEEQKIWKKNLTQIIRRFK